MAILDARHLDTDAEGADRLLAALHGTGQGRGRAILRGRRRAARSADGWNTARPARGTAAIDLDASPAN